MYTLKVLISNNRKFLNTLALVRVQDLSGLAKNLKRNPRRL